MKPADITTSNGILKPSPGSPGGQRPGSVDAPAGFEGALAALQSPPPARTDGILPWVAPSADRNQAQASEVFEAPGAEPRQQRLDTLRHDARQEALTHSATHRPEARALRFETETVSARTGITDEFNASASLQGLAGRAGHRPTTGDQSASASVSGNASALREQAQVGHVTLDRRSDSMEGWASRIAAPARETAAGTPPTTETNGAQTSPSNPSITTPAQAIAEFIARPAAHATKLEPSLPVTSGPSPTSAPASTGAASRPGSNGPAAPGSSSAPASTPTKPEASAFEKLVRSVKIEHGSKSSTATIELDPPDLGRIRVEARMSGETLELSIQAESAAARHLLGERLNELRQTLEQHGVRTGAFDLSNWSPGESASDAAAGGFADAGQTPTLFRETEEESTAGSAPETASAASDAAEAITVEAPSWSASGRLDIRV